MEKQHIEMRRTVFLLIAALAAMSLSAQTPVDAGLRSIGRLSAQSVVEFLASDSLCGRKAGTREAWVASRYVASMLEWTGVKPLDDGYFQPFACWRRTGQRKWQPGACPDSVRQLPQAQWQELRMRNVLGMIPGRRTGEYVVVGAHFDHLGVGEAKDGDRIYNGADDNASGVSAVLQIARAFVASGQQPERNVVFAFWDGEEEGLLGSRHFVRSCPFLPSVRGYLNFDMIGRNHVPGNPRHVVCFYTASHPAFGEWLKEDIAARGLCLEPDYRAWDKPLSGSDNASFAAAGIPIIWFHTDGHADYHQPSDHADRLNWEKVTDITRAAFLSLWRMANEDGAW